MLDYRSIPFLVGVSYRTCPATVRDLLYTDEAEIPAVLHALRRAGVTQALWLATCDRVEVWGCHQLADQAALTAAEVLASRGALPLEELGTQLYSLAGPAALRHQFAVASSLESQVVGEPYILGQVKAGVRAAESAGMVGPDLANVLRAALGAAKRVRTETAIGEHPTSVAAAAVRIVRELHGTLGNCRALLVGLADMGVLMTEELRAAGLSGLTVTAPNERRAESLARRLRGHYAPFESLETALAGTDIVVASAGLGRFLLTPDVVQTALRRRRHRPLLLIDAAVPADIDPQVQSLDAAFVYDLGDLERVALDGRVKREAEAAAAWEIVEAAVAEHLRSRAERQAVPLVAALRNRFEGERERLLAERAGIDAAEATRLLVNRLLHQPSEMLRRMAADPGAAGLPDRIAAERLLNRLFGLQAEVVNGDQDQGCGGHIGMAGAAELDPKDDGL